MALIDYIDADARRIHLSSDSVGVSWHPYEIYNEVRTLRRTTESLRGYDNFMEGAGNVNKGGGKSTERYFILMLGTRIVPFDTSHGVTVTGTLISDDGLEGILCFDRSSLSPTTQIDIDYAPKQVEVINLNFDDLVYSSFQGAVWLDMANGNNNIGTTNFPNGNEERPVNSITLVKEVTALRGFTKIRIIGNATIAAGDDLEGYTLIGENTERTSVTVDSSANTDNIEYKFCTLSGVLGINTYLSNCVTNDLIINGGTIIDTLISGLPSQTLTLAGNMRVTMMNCFSGQPVATAPIIDLGVSGQDLIMRNWHGVIHFANKDSAATDDFCIGGSPAIIRFGSDFDASGGNASVYGHGLIIEQVGTVPALSGGFIINGSITAQDITDISTASATSTWDRLISGGFISGSMGEYVSKKLLSVNKFLGLK